MATLFDGSGSEDETNLKINKDYADSYNNWREKEEFQKLKDKYGEEAALKQILEHDNDSSLSSSESEDDDGEAWGPDVDKQFFQTIALLKTKDPSIYENGKQFFNKNEQPNAEQPKKKAKKEEKITLRDYERKLVLEKGGRISDEEDELPTQTFQQEQEELKKGFKMIVNAPDSDDEDILTVRQKSFKQQEMEEEEYREWLKGHKNELNDNEAKNKLEPLKKYWNDPNLEENEKFLKDFFLNKRYKDLDDKNYIPSYEEVVHDSEEDLSEDEKTLEKQQEFEHKYNFRFEEPDPEFIKRFPRTIKDSMRRPDTKRKEKRQEINERKKREKEEKKEELRQLKKYKLNEIREKLEQLKSITGNSSLPFQDNELEGDFNPEEYDKKMSSYFNQDYYQVEEGDKKPEFPFDPEIDDENWDAYTGQDGEPVPSTSNADAEYEPHCEDPDFIMDCEYEEKVKSKETTEITRRGRGRKKSLFAKKLESKKPVFDPTQYPNYEEYLEEYYKLDFEDIVGDQPVRFKYRNVVPNDFGLDTEEILAAREKELNHWCSVKKMSQYRNEQEELYDLKTFNGKRQNLALKKKVLPSLFVENSEELVVEEQEADRKKRRRKQGKDEDVKQDESVVNPSRKSDEGSTNIKQNRKKRKDSQKNTESHVDKMNDERTNPRNDELQRTEDPGTTALATEKETAKKKKKKQKQKSTASEPNEVINKNPSCAAEPDGVQQSAAKTKKLKKKQRKKNKEKGVCATTAQPGKIFKNSKKAALPALSLTDDRLKAYGINPKKFKNSLKYGKKAKQ
nr:EOG090X05XL [Ilyocryptus agilis]